MDRVVLTMQDLRAVRFAETESRIVGARDWGVGTGEFVFKGGQLYEMKSSGGGRW